MPKEDQELLLDGKCIFMRLKINEKKAELDVEKHLISLLFNEPNFPKVDQELTEGS